MGGGGGGEEGEQIAKVGNMREKTFLREQGNTSQFLKETREQGPPLGDPYLCVLHITSQQRNVIPLNASELRSGTVYQHNDIFR